MSSAQCTPRRVCACESVSGHRACLLKLPNAFDPSLSPPATPYTLKMVALRVRGRRAAQVAPLRNHLTAPHVTFNSSWRVALIWRSPGIAFVYCVFRSPMVFYVHLLGLLLQVMPRSCFLLYFYFVWYRSVCLYFVLALAFMFIST